ncbi:esterase-like activity of phytase family protein [Dyadobacter sp. 32]|uniref:esterase-like activity of phytase family protein n=1 Tax=Dyadobacter sp. 32 TaxID=538966 RepID=UPI0011ECA545
MKNALWFLMVLFWFSMANGQNLQFSFSDSTFLPAKPTGQLHGISGIDYVASSDQWHWASDRGGYFVFDSVKTIRDFALMQKTLVPKLTTYWFESVRIDPVTGRFFFAVENDYLPSWTNTHTTTYVASFPSFPPRQAEPDYLVAPLKLPADNKGIEGIAITPAGNVWVAPEAGWAGETEIGQDTIHFLKFKKTFSGYAPAGQFSYVIDRSGCPYGTSETRGGISEILSVNESQLLVLERCYDNGAKGSKKIKAKLWEVTVDGYHLKKAAEPAFNFNSGLKFTPDNVEAMSWWKRKDGKRQLVIVSDDNPGDNNKQRTQVILLKEN